MKIFSSRLLFLPLTLCLCLLVLELSSKCNASENSNSNATSRAFTHHGAGYNKQAVWTNPGSVKRDSGYGDSQYNSNSNSDSSSAAAVAAVLNSDGTQQQSSSSSFDSYSSSSFDNEGKAMGANGYADSYGVPSPSSSYGMSDYGMHQAHMMPEPSSMKYHYKVIPHQEMSGMGWGEEEDDGDSSIKEYIGIIKGIKGIKAIKGLKGLGLLGLPLLPFLPIIIPLVMALPLLPLIGAAILFFLFPIPIITTPFTRIGTAGAGTGTGTAGTNPISQVFPALFPINVGGRTSQELWNSSNLNESEKFFSREASRVLNDENLYSRLDYIRNMVKAVATEIYFSTPTKTRARDLKDDKSPNPSKNQCLERMACELTQFLKKISPKSSMFITGTMKKFLGSENTISRQIKTGISSSPIEISGNGSEVKVKTCKERFLCDRLKEESHVDQSKFKTTA